MDKVPFFLFKLDSEQLLLLPREDPQLGVLHLGEANCGINLQRTAWAVAWVAMNAWAMHQHLVWAVVVGFEMSLGQDWSKSKALGQIMQVFLARYIQTGVLANGLRSSLHLWFESFKL